MRILLVDDEEELVSALAERLSFRNIEADWTTRPEEALRLSGEREYDLAVLDVKMPRMSGLDLQRRLQKQHPGLKFIFLTGHGSHQDFKDASQEAWAYLVKPVPLEEIIDRIHSALASGGSGQREGKGANHDQ
jgi:DNA-binding response OmpR family regulator